MNANTFERVCKCLKSVRSIRKTIEPSDRFIQDLNCESVDVVDLLFFLDEEFKVRITMNEFHQYVIKTTKFMRWDFTIEMVCTLVDGKMK